MKRATLKSVPGREILSGENTDDLDPVLSGDLSPLVEKGTQEESEVLPDIVLHRSLMNDLLIVVSFIAGLCIVWWYTLSYYDSLKALSSYEPFLAVTLVSAVAAILVAGVIMFRRYNVRYLILDDGIQALRGILSNDQIEMKLEYYQIRGTEIRRSLFQRLVGTGDLLVRGSGTDNREVTFGGIANPSYYQKFIQYRHRLEVQGSEEAWINSGNRSDASRENSRL